VLKGAVTQANREPGQTLSTAPHQRHRLYAVAENNEKVQHVDETDARNLPRKPPVDFWYPEKSGNMDNNKVNNSKARPHLQDYTKTGAKSNSTTERARSSYPRDLGKMIDSTKSSSHSHNNASTHWDSGGGSPPTPSSTTAGRDQRRGRASLHDSSMKRLPLSKKDKSQLADMYKELDD
jgi:site-specific DNA-cytosine methylase